MFTHTWLFSCFTDTVNPSQPERSGTPAAKTLENTHASNAPVARYIAPPATDNIHLLTYLGCQAGNDQWQQFRA